MTLHDLSVPYKNGRDGKQWTYKAGTYFLLLKQEAIPEVKIFKAGIVLVGEQKGWIYIFQKNDGSFLDFEKVEAP